MDRSKWAKTPAVWKTETVEIECATPDGVKRKSIVYHSNTLGMKLVRIEPGSFWMGLTKEQAARMSAEKKIGCPVTLTKAYYLAAHETTLPLFEQFDPTFKQRRLKHQRGNDFDAHPVEGVTWQEAQKFCRWLSEKEGRLYRLPTEAEWEFACKAGTTTVLYWGDAPWDRLKANAGGLRSLPESYVEDGYEFTAPVGTYPANPWGLYDMVGNVWEWVGDWFDWYPQGPLTDPKGPATGRLRVDKGASWSTRTRDLKSCARDGNNPADRFETYGFRVLCEE